LNPVDIDDGGCSEGEGFAMTADAAESPTLPDDLDEPIGWCNAMAAEMRRIATQPVRPEVKADLILLARRYERLAIRLETGDESRGKVSQ
jgi:hypothetical protein